MSTIESPTPAVEETGRGGRRPLIVVLVTVVALLLGALGGWLIRGSDDDTANDTTDEAIEVVTGELTERQQEMLRIADEQYEAFRSGDGEALAALYVPQGVLTDAFGAVHRADDGTMASMFERYAPPSLMEMMPPALVIENVMSEVVDWGEGRFGSVLHRFTTSGDVLIVSTNYSGPGGP